MEWKNARAIRQMARPSNKLPSELKFSLKTNRLYIALYQKLSYSFRSLVLTNQIEEFLANFVFNWNLLNFFCKYEIIWSPWLKFGVEVTLGGGMDWAEETSPLRASGEESPLLRGATAFTGDLLSLASTVEKGGQWSKSVSNNCPWVLGNLLLATILWRSWRLWWDP